MNVYKGDQPFADFLVLQAQGQLFDKPVTDRESVKRKLEVLAARVVEDLGREASWADLKDTLKSRAAGKLIYDFGLGVTALENALRSRGQAAQ